MISCVSDMGLGCFMRIMTILSGKPALNHPVEGNDSIGFFQHCSACRAPARFSSINPQRFWMRNVGTGSSRICPDTRATGYFSHSIHGRILVGWHQHKARITNSQPLTIQLAPDFGHQCRTCDYHIDKQGKPLTQIARNLTEIILDLSWQTTFCTFLKIPDAVFEWWLLHWSLALNSMPQKSAEANMVGWWKKISENWRFW